VGTDGKLDQIDLKILSRLQADGRLHNNQLAEAVGLSASPCLQRVRRLEKQGVITRYMAVLALDKLCRHVDVLAAVTLRNHAPEDFEQFEAATRQMPEIVACHKVSGTVDYILRFVCPSLEVYHARSDRLLKEGPGVAHISSHVVLDRVKDFVGYPLEILL
jgi:DNA-binding Lrp family transcriptional regulator